MYRNIIFDLDGTLTDSMPMHAEAWVRAFRDYAKLQIADNEAYLREGEKGEDFARYVFNKYTGDTLADEDVLPLVNLYSNNYREIYEVRFFPGAKQLIQNLQRSDYQLGLVSGSKDIKSRLSAHQDLLSCFSVIITGDDTPVGKPDPAPFKLAISQLGVSAKEVLVIENAPFGLQSGVGAGATCWAVRNSSPLTAEQLLSFGASRVFERISEIWSALEP